MVDLKQILSDYFSGSFKDEGYKKIRAIFETGNGEDELRQVMKDKWHEIQDEDLPYADLAPVLNRIHRNINLSGSGKNKGQSIFSVILKVAAVIMLPFLVASLWIANNYYQKQKTLMNTWSELVAPGGGRINFVLPDGTTGWLNGYSKLTFPLLFGKERNVKVAGEAYFDVIHDNQSPFIVDIPVSRLKVLGTRFSVTAFEEDNTSEVVLESGKVEVMNKKQNNTLQLAPDRHMVINNLTGECSIDNINALNFVSWKDGLLIFRNELMADVTKRLSRWYNVDIEMKGQKLYEYRFRATFKDESLEEVLNLLKISSPIDYSISERIMQEDGQFSRRKVTLSLKKSKTSKSAGN